MALSILPNAFGQPALTPEQIKKLNEFFEKEKIPRIRSHNSGLVIFPVWEYLEKKNGKRP
jgi:hypothetical protein